MDDLERCFVFMLRKALDELPEESREEWRHNCIEKYPDFTVLVNSFLEPYPPEED